LKKSESQVRKLNRKNAEYKKYVKQVEDTVIKNDEKLKFLELFKKNSEICSTVESYDPRRDELENFGK